ncbi:hypothetical protein [Duganella callida]|uniref:Uncharacterized protein n=1 Tax=Duganella callida TaxID=2561932 RepID=A0A4Y9S951_9BURK|nr:hypothetical protein [Duganella callida]TFW16619.1 hypothetical protein E4L98_22920 [Duganella callida]
MSEHIYLLTLGLPLGTVLLIFVLRYLAVIKRARLQEDNQESYRLLAERATAAQAETAAALADLKTRIIAIEKVLKEVE